MRVPKLRRNGDGRAFVEYKKRRHYLGVYGTSAAEQAYQRFLAEIFGGTVAALPARSPMSIAMAVSAYIEHARTYYSRDGRPTKEYQNVLNALSPLVPMYPELPVSQFGPRHLAQLQQRMVLLGWRHRVVNARLGRVRRMFRWLVQHEYIDGTQLQSLMAVPGLRRGQLGVKPSRKVKPVALEHVNAVVPFVSPTTAAMIQAQLWCGMRPAEVCVMRPCDIDRSGDIWIYRPAQHKGDWLDKECVKAVPRFVQPIISPFLERPESDYLFKPIESIRWHAAQRASANERKHPVYPCELRRRQKSRERAEVEKRPRYDSTSYYRAVVRGIDKARSAGVELPHWHPHQLRHAIADYVSETMGEQAAQRWLWHERLETTAIYTEKKVTELVEIARALDKRAAG